MLEAVYTFPDAPAAAYGDESFLEATAGGYYVLASATFAPETVEQAREAMLAIRGTRRTDKLHWNEMDARQHKSAAREVAALDGFHVVVVGTPVPERRQNRARAQCLTRLVAELHGFGVQDLYLESRDPTQDRRDVATVVSARYALPKGTRFTVGHLQGGREPLLWAADIVAGAVRAHRHGEGTYRDILGDCLYDVEILTGC